MNTYVWCEDSGSGFDFWSKVFGVLHSTFIVETKKNNTELCKAVSRIVDDDNQYYIILDHAIDNPEVLRETKRLYNLTKDRNNIKVIGLHSFEFVLLSFKFLEDWIFAKGDNLKEKRESIFDLKDSFVDIIINGGDADNLSDLKKKWGGSESLNTEKFAAKLLFEITRNTGFETTKGKLGDCFVVDCCTWEQRESDDICGLDYERKSADSKIVEIYENSVLKDAFAKVGL